jgi:hypothetical protein
MPDPTPNDSGVIRKLLFVLIIGIAALVIWWGGTYFIHLLNAPGWALAAWDGLFVILGIIFVVNFLLGLVGREFIKW